MRARIYDKDGGFTDYTTTITINNVNPTAGVAGPTSGVRGQPHSFTFTANDPSPVDQAAGFVYTITWGDGSPVHCAHRRQRQRRRVVATQVHVTHVTRATTGVDHDRVVTDGAAGDAGNDRLQGGAGDDVLILFMASLGWAEACPKLV